MATRKSTGLAPYERLWPDAQRGPWLVTAQFARVDGRMEVVGLELRSARRHKRDDDGRIVDAEPRLREVLPPAYPDLENLTGREPLPLKSEVWRSLPVAALSTELRASWVDALDDSGLLAANPRAAARWQGPREDRRVTLEDVAAIYLDALDEGRPPTKAVQEALHLSKSAAAQRVARARAAGLLGETRKGLPSRAPGASPNVTAAESLEAPKGQRGRGRRGRGREGGK